MLEDAGELELRIDPRRIVVAQLHDVGQPREPLESSAIRGLVAEDRRPDVRVEDDRPAPCLTIDQRLVGCCGRVDRQSQRPDVNRPHVLWQRGHGFRQQVGEGRPGQIEGVGVPSVVLPMDDGERCRGIGPAHERHVDARLEQPTGEQTAVLVVRKCSEKRHRDPQPTERDRGVERAAAGDWPMQAVLVDEVDESLAPDDDHGARSAGGISPEPRAISLTGTIWCTVGEVSPSSRRNRRSAADRPSACGS